MAISIRPVEKAINQSEPIRQRGKSLPGSGKDQKIPTAAANDPDHQRSKVHKKQIQKAENSPDQEQHSPATQDGPELQQARRAGAGSAAGSAGGGQGCAEAKRCRRDLPRRRGRDHTWRRQTLGVQVGAQHPQQPWWVVDSNGGGVVVGRNAEVASMVVW